MGEGRKSYVDNHASTSSPTRDAEVLFQGLYWGGNSDASERASKEEQISSSGIEDRSCWTGEQAGTGSPAEDLQLNESHLAGILDDIFVSDSVSEV